MHNIAVINGREAMSYSGIPPWHELGAELTRVDSVETALAEANLDWNVSKHPVYLSGNELTNDPEGLEPNGRFLLGNEIKDIKAVVRDIDSEILGTVGSRYQLIQNAEAFAPLQYAIDNYGATIETAGALGKGDRVWMLLKLASHSLEVSPGDVIEPYFLVSNSHTRERSQTLTARFTPVRVVCQNTLDAATSASSVADISIRHTASAQGRLAEIERLVESVLIQHTSTVEVYQQLQQQPISIVDMAEFLLEVWPVPADDQLAEMQILREDYKPTEEHYRRNSLFLFQNGNGHELAGSTAFGAYQAITELVDHAAVMRLDGKRKTQGSMSALFGTGAVTKKRALEIARQRWL
jgi:phage/plasmid-like protein (TIGR03299 family)